MITKLFLDTASLKEIKFWSQFGLVEGVTTNPKLLSLEKNDPYDQVRTISKMVKGPVSAQLTMTDTDLMIKQGIKLSKINKNIVIKVPLIQNSLDVAQALSKKNIKLNITLGFDPGQILLFNNIKIEFFSFIIARVEDFGLSNIDNLYHITKISRKMKYKPKILAASIRNSIHLINSFSAGCDAITVPPTTWSNLLNLELSQNGQLDFLNSWKKLNIKESKYET